MSILKTTWAIGHYVDANKEISADGYKEVTAWMQNYKFTISPQGVKCHKIIEQSNGKLKNSDYLEMQEQYNDWYKIVVQDEARQLLYSESN